MTDQDYLALAVAEARRGLGQTSPNPAVGAILVKDGEVIGRGWHRQCGCPHAEREALADARLRCSDEEIRGATIYVTLEPCSTHGRTGACTQAIIEAGIERCVYAVSDPNPAHAGRADEVLGAEGVEVCGGVDVAGVEDLIRGFRSVQLLDRPWVVAKAAMSLDGKITRPPSEGQWLTGPEARVKVMELRAEVDAIVTGGETVRQDDPALTVRGENFAQDRRQPIRAVMQREGSTALPESSQIFTDEWSDRTRVYAGKTAAEVLDELKREGANTVLLEAGGELLGLFSDAGLIDEWVCFLAPILTGGDKLGVAGEGAAAIAEATQLTDVEFELCGQDVLLRGRT